MEDNILFFGNVEMYEPRHSKPSRIEPTQNSTTQKPPVANQK